MKKLLLLFLFSFSLYSCLSGQDCPQNINVLPLYGRAKKCKEQIDNDKQFISECDKTFPSRDSAYRHHIMRGWQYFDRDSINTSMKRFNQAWLLDSTKAEAYWGIGSLLGKKGEFNKSIEFFEKALSLKKITQLLCTESA